MNFTKPLVGLTVVAALTAATVVESSARNRDRAWIGAGAGLAAGVAIGAAAANARANAYYNHPYYAYDAYAYDPYYGGRVTVAPAYPTYYPAYPSYYPYSSEPSCASDGGYGRTDHGAC